MQLNMSIYGKDVNSKQGENNPQNNPRTKTRDKLPMYYGGIKTLESVRNSVSVADYPA